MKNWLFFIIVTLTTVTFISASVARNLEQKKIDLKKAFKAGAITKLEYNKSNDYLKNLEKKKDNKKEKKNLILTNKKKNNKLKKFLSVNKEDKEEITLKKLEELGQIIKFDDTYYPESMLKKLSKGCQGFKCKGSKAGKFLFNAFGKSKSYSQQNPGQMIKAMGMFEVFYSSKLWFARESIERYKNDDYAGSRKFFYKKKDEKEIRSLLGINKGRKSMREALGMSMETPSKEAIKKFWLLGEFLDLGTGVKNKKLTKDLKQRQIKLANYKSQISILKKKLQEDLDKEENEKQIK